MKTIALTIDGAGVTIPRFIAAIKQAKESPERTFNRSIKRWWSRTGAQILQEYHEIIDENINRRGKLIIREVKNYSALRHFQRLINGNFIVRETDIPPKYRKRFKERIYHGQD